MNKIDLSSPWAIRVAQIKTLFEKDPDITIKYNEDDYTLRLFVDNTNKADALTKLLPTSYEFGNVTLKIEVVSANEEETLVELYNDIFYGNPIFEKAYSTTDIMGIFHNFILFKPVVAQYYNDDISEPYGFCNTLYQELAKEIFGEETNVKFSTELIK